MSLKIGRTYIYDPGDAASVLKGTVVKVVSVTTYDPESVTRVQVVAYGPLVLDGDKRNIPIGFTWDCANKYLRPGKSGFGQWFKEHS